MDMINKDIKKLSDIAMSLLMEKRAKTHRVCFTQKEFEEHSAEIFAITGAKHRLEETIKNQQKIINKYQNNA